MCVLVLRSTVGSKSPPSVPVWHREMPTPYLKHCQPWDVPPHVPRNVTLRKIAGGRINLKSDGHRYGIEHSSHSREGDQRTADRREKTRRDVRKEKLGLVTALGSKTKTSSTPVQPEPQPLRFPLPPSDRHKNRKTSHPHSHFQRR